MLTLAERCKDKYYHVTINGEKLECVHAQSIQQALRGIADISLDEDDVIVIQREK